MGSPYGKRIAQGDGGSTPAEALDTCHIYDRRHTDEVLMKSLALLLFSCGAITAVVKPADLRPVSKPSWVQAMEVPRLCHILLHRHGLPGRVQE
jgi:hypothetical protein